jgi:hypothetical protein
MSGEEKKPDLITIGSKSATKEEWKKATNETIEVWVKWTMRLVVWSIWATSIYTYWWKHNVELSVIYVILSICVSISNKLYNLEKKLIK